MRYLLWLVVARAFMIVPINYGHKLAYHDGTLLFTSETPPVDVKKKVLYDGAGMMRTGLYVKHGNFIGVENGAVKFITLISTENSPKSGSIDAAESLELKPIDYDAIGFRIELGDSADRLKLRHVATNMCLVMDTNNNLSLDKCEQPNAEFHLPGINTPQDNTTKKSASAPPPEEGKKRKTEGKGASKEGPKNAPPAGENAAPAGQRQSGHLPVVRRGSQGGSRQRQDQSSSVDESNYASGGQGHGGKGKPTQPIIIFQVPPTSGSQASPPQGTSYSPNQPQVPPSSPAPPQGTSYSQNQPQAPSSSPPQLTGNPQVQPQHTHSGPKDSSPPTHINGIPIGNILSNVNSLPLSDTGLQPQSVPLQQPSQQPAQSSQPQYQSPQTPPPSQQLAQNPQPQYQSPPPQSVSPTAQNPQPQYQSPQSPPPQLPQPTQTPLASPQVQQQQPQSPPSQLPQPTQTPPPSPQVQQQQPQSTPPPSPQAQQPTGYGTSASQNPQAQVDNQPPNLADTGKNIMKVAQTEALTAAHNMLWNVLNQTPFRPPRGYYNTPPPA